MISSSEYLERLAVDAYKFEHDRKERILANAVIPLNGLILILGGFGYLLPRLPGVAWSGCRFALTATALAAWGFAVLAVCFAVRSFYLSYKLIAKNPYRYLPEIGEIDAYAGQLRAYYQATGEERLEERVTEDLRRLIIEECAECVRVCSATNEERIGRRNILMQRIAITGILIVSAIALSAISSRLIH